jgi:hypothetical protein
MTNEQLFSETDSQEMFQRNAPCVCSVADDPGKADAKIYGSYWLSRGEVVVLSAAKQRTTKCTTQPCSPAHGDNSYHAHEDLRAYPQSV